MKILETKMIDVKDIEVGKDLVRPLEDIKNNEDLKNLSDSITEKGQLHPCMIRIVKGRNELIAGARRYLAILQKGGKVEVKICDASDLEAMELSVIENTHRKEQDVKQRDDYIYKIWKKGKKSGEYKSQTDFSKRLSLDLSLIYKIIYAGETAEKEEYKKSKVIQNATTRELVVTRPLSGVPKIREKIVSLGQNRNISDKHMDNLSKKIGSMVNNGISKETIEKTFDLFVPTNVVSMKDMKTNVDNILSSDVDEPVLVFKPNKFERALDMIEKAPKDVVEKLVSKNITLEQAEMVVSKGFETNKARDQILNEIKKKEEKKNLTQEVAQKLYEDGVKEHLEVRKKQEQEMKTNGDTSLKTQSDIEKQKRLDDEINKDRIHDDTFVDKYQRVSSATINAFTHYHPKRLRTVESKDMVLSMIKNLYKLYHNMLVDIGEIKEVRVENGKANNNDTKYLNAIDAEIVAKQ